MPNWKKVIVSGSNAELNSLILTSGLTVTGSIQQDNGDLLIKTANGGYFQVDESDNSVKFSDDVTAKFGTGNDLQIYHDVSNSYIDQIGIGDLLIKTSNGTSDIKLQSGSVDFLIIDSSQTAIRMKRLTKWDDNIKATFGDGGDLEFYHNGTNSVINNITNNLQIINNANDGDISFQSDDGSGGTAEYFRLDGSTEQNVFSKDILVTNALLSNQQNTDVDTGTETVATVAHASYDAAFFDFVIVSGSNLRAGTVYAAHDGTNVEFTETSTQDLGSTSDVTLSVDISGADLRLRATTTSDNWTIKSLVRGL